LAKITFDLDDKIDEKFRKVVADTKGLHRGVIQEALEEAIQLWLAEQVKNKSQK
jgi:hypothetical protein